MKLSVIIPCYNFENYIDQAILSALSQKTNFEYEILVGDDSSTDKSYMNIERYAYTPSVTIIKYPINLGGQMNIKTLIEKSKGEYIAYLDGDDYWVDTYKLQKQIDYMESNPDCMMTFTGYWIKNEQGYIPQSVGSWLSIPGTYTNGQVLTEHLLRGNPATFGRVFRNVPGLIKDWMLDIKYLDWVTNYELSKLGRLQYLDFPSGVYRQHNTSIFSSVELADREVIADEVRRILKEDYQKYKSL